MLLPLRNYARVRRLARLERFPPRRQISREQGRLSGALVCGAGPQPSWSRRCYAIPKAAYRIQCPLTQTQRKPFQRQRPDTQRGAAQPRGGGGPRSTLGGRIGGRWRGVVVACLRGRDQARWTASRARTRWRAGHLQGRDQTEADHRPARNRVGAAPRRCATDRPRLRGTPPAPLCDHAFTPFLSAHLVFNDIVQECSAND